MTTAVIVFARQAKLGVLLRTLVSKFLPAVQPATLAEAASASKLATPGVRSLTLALQFLLDVLRTMIHAEIAFAKTGILGAVLKIYAFARLLVARPMMTAATA